MSIITVAEILEITPRAQGTDPNIPEALLKQKEEGLFRVWLGYDWYFDLKTDLTDFSASVPFVEGTSYSISNLVSWKNRYYSCILGTDGSQLPNNTTHFELASKFQTSANQTLYDEYLKYVLAWGVFHSSVVYEAIRTTQLGVQRYGENESFKNRPTTARELAAFKNEIGDDLNLMLQNMDRYLRDNSSTFPKYRGNQQSSESIDAGIGKRRRNHGFTTW